MNNQIITLAALSAINNVNPEQNEIDTILAHYSTDMQISTDTFVNEVYDMIALLNNNSKLKLA